MDEDCHCVIENKFGKVIAAVVVSVSYRKLQSFLFLCLLCLLSTSDWEDNFRINFSDAIGSTESKYYPITTRLRKLFTLPPPFMRNVALDGVQDSSFSTFNQKSSNKEMTT